MKYQMKLKKTLRDLYQSNDPLRYVYIANHTGVNRYMTDREARIFRKRTIEMFKKLGANIKEVMNSFSKVLTNVAANLPKIIKDFKKFNENSPMMKVDMSVKMPDFDNDSTSRMIMRSSLYQSKIEMPKINLMLKGVGDVEDHKEK